MSDSSSDIARNPGMPLDFSVVHNLKVNTNGVRERASDYGTRRSLKKEWQAAWLLKAASLIDLTTLNGDDTKGKVERLCAKAKKPVDPKILAGLEVAADGFSTAAVCVYHRHVAEAVEFLKGTNIPVAVVSTGFPDGQTPHETSLEEIKASVAAGATEVDIVITRELALTQDWQSLYDQIKDYREACGDAHIKVIFGTGNLGSLENVAKVSMVAMMAGADFIKTSTGKEKVNANLPVSLVMMRAIRDYHEMTGYKVGYKPAGGISSAKEAVTYLTMVKDELGDEWLRPELFRFGASSLLNDIERQLEHQVTGRYSAGYRHAMS